MFAIMKRALIEISIINDYDDRIFAGSVGLLTILGVKNVMGMSSLLS